MMTTSALLIFFLICITMTTCAGFPTSIFILAGQSNMVGQGGVFNNTWDGVVPPLCQPDPDRILRLNNDLSWEAAKEPLHLGLRANAPSCGIGPGMPFANSLPLSSDDQLIIGLVPCASAATNISQWARGTFLYDRMITRARAATANNSAQIRALLWYQGESDTRTEDNAVLYKQRLEKFFTDVRSDLSSPQLPIIQVALASRAGPYMDTVRKAQLGTSSCLPNVRCVDAWGLDVIPPDNIHLTTESEVKLGIMLADTFIHSFT